MSLLNLRIADYIPADEKLIKNTDFTLFLRKESPTYEKGRKATAEYRDVDTGLLVCKKTFADVLVGNDIQEITITIEWFNDDDTVGLTKIFTKPLTVMESENLKRKRRIRAMDYLKAGAKGTPIESHVNAIFTHYEQDIRHWYDLGGTELLDKVNNETDPTILSYMAIETEPGWTVKDGILSQIS